MEFQIIKLDMIDPNPNQPRKDFGDDTLQELAESVKQVGVLVPLLVRPLNGRYEIVHGERRWRAAKMAGLSQVPARVQPLTDTEAFIISLNENLQRQNLNPIEEAKAYSWLQDQGYSQAKIGEIIGKSQQYVASRLVLLALPPGVKEKITTHVVSPSHGEVLVSLKSTTLTEKFAKQVEQGKLTVRQLEWAVHRHKELDETLRGFEKLGVTAPNPKIRVDDKGMVSAENALRVSCELRELEATMAIQRQGYYVRFWNGCLPKIEDNSYELVSKEEWELAHKFEPNDYYEIYWGDKFERTRQSGDSDLGEEIITHWSADGPELRYILPAGRWGWYEFPLEKTGQTLQTYNLAFPKGMVHSAKVVRRRLFCPYIIQSDDYAKLLAVLSGDFCFAGTLAVFHTLSWVPKGSEIPWFDRRFFHEDSVVPKRRLLAVLKEDLQLSYEPAWADIRSPFRSPEKEWHNVLQSRPDVFEHIRSMAKTMTESKRRMVMKQIGVNA